MKTTIFKKTLAVLAAVMLVASMMVPMASVTASASAAPLSHIDDSSSGVRAFRVIKEINMRNAAAGEYNQPTITYNYTLEPWTHDSSTPEYVTGDSETVYVQNSFGVGTYVYLSTTVGQKTETSVSYSNNDKYTVSNVDNGTNVTKDFSVYVNANGFTKPGIYRYIIHETTTENELFNVGIVRGPDYSSYRYLDLYITRTESGLEATYAVIYTTNLPSYAANTYTTGKCQGWEAPTTQSAMGAADYYRTYNIKISKSVEGDLGDRTHSFPFTVMINNTNSATRYEEVDGVDTFMGSLSNLKYKWAIADTSTDPSIYNTDTTNKMLGSAENVKLTHGQSIYIRGLSPKAEICVGETNDTEETYKVTVHGDNGLTGNAHATQDYRGTNGSWANGVVVNKSEIIRLNDLASGTNHVQTTHITDYNTVNETHPYSMANTTTVRYLTFTNYCQSVSPTGVVLRFGAFIIMAGFGVFFLILAAKSRRREATSVI